MGCCCSRQRRARRRHPPDPSVRQVWHSVSAILIETASEKSKVERRRVGMAYIYNGSLWLAPGCCSTWEEPISFPLTSIQHAIAVQQFQSRNDGERRYSGKMVDISLSPVHPGDPTHIALIADNYDEICNELNDVIRKHRQKPKIFQFNSIDIEGVEVDLP